MIITKIEVQKKNKEKVNIFIEDEYSFSLSLNGVTKYGLYNGKDILSEEIEEIKKKDSSELAYLFLMNRIASKMYTEKELRDKLKLKEFDESSINEAIERASEYGYINDTYYAKCYIEQKGIPNKLGPKIILQKLLQKGIKKDIINDALSEFFTDEDEINNCYDLVVKKMKNLKMENFDDRKNCDKLYRFLLSKGYTYDTINSCLDKVKREII